MIYVSSDWHGCSTDTVQNLFNKAGFTDNDFCIVLGDVIDRGKNGVELLQWLMSRKNIELLRGNHEEMMLANEYLFDKISDTANENPGRAKSNSEGIWLLNGAKPTVEALKKLDEAERKNIYKYVSDTALYKYVEVNDKTFLLTHSGLMNFRPDRKLTEYSHTELLWNRPTASSYYFQDIVTVFGHTPTIRFGSEYKTKAVKTKTWIDIDTGAALGGNPMLLRLDDLQAFYI